MRCLVFFLLINGIGGFFNTGYSQELDRSKFQKSSLVSREIAEKQLNRIYQLVGKLQTFHCGCNFDKIKQVFPNICASNSKVTLDNKGNVLTGNNMMTSKEKIFACGDMHHGQSLVVRAIASGRDCARNIDIWLMGTSNLPKVRGFARSN